MSEAAAKRTANTITSVADSAETSTSIEVLFSLKIDLRLLRRQKHDLLAIPQDFQLSRKQDEAIEGILNMIDFI